VPAARRPLWRALKGRRHSWPAEGDRASLPINSTVIGRVGGGLSLARLSCLGAPVRSGSAWGPNQIERADCAASPEVAVGQGPVDSCAFGRLASSRSQALEPALLRLELIVLLLPAAMGVGSWIDLCPTLASPLGRPGRTKTIGCGASYAALNGRIDFDDSLSPPHERARPLAREPQASQGSLQVTAAFADRPLGGVCP